jgi:hypothetical protein
MWRYLDGAKKPEKKQTLTDQKKLEYERNRRKRKFIDKWLVGRPWLVDM